MSRVRVDRRGFLDAGAAVGGGLLLLAHGGPAASARPNIVRSPAQWRAQLGSARYHILREGGTERPFSSPLLGEHRKGIFVCAGCSRPLFSSATKFESGTGWPSFWKALPGAVAERTDRSLLMERIEVRCSRCDGHLGHVFKDGPRPTGLRYCMNGLALGFHAA